MGWFDGIPILGDIASGVDSLVGGLTSSGAGDAASAATGAATDAASSAGSSGGSSLFGGALNSALNFFGLGGGYGDPNTAQGVANAGALNSLYGDTTPTPPTPPGYDPTASLSSNNMNVMDAANKAMGATAAGAAPVSGGMNKTALALAALAALGSAMSKPKQGTWPTPGPNSNTATLGPYYNQPLNTNVPGRAAVSPGLPTTQGGQAAPPNYWTYGGPEQTYFTGNSLKNFGFAHGGEVGALGMAHGGGHGEFSTATGAHHVRGEGDGISDSVPARLSDGEYVLTAADVSRLGRGSNDAGAKKLDQFREHLARESGQKKFIPAKVGGALNQLAGAA